MYKSRQCQSTNSFFFICVYEPFFQIQMRLHISSKLVNISDRKGDPKLACVQQSCILHVAGAVGHAVLSARSA